MRTRAHAQDLTAPIAREEKQTICLLLILQGATP